MPYTIEEITLCTYAALYNDDDFGGIAAIAALTHRSIDSIKMKIQNIAAMLDENHIERFTYDTVQPLTGLPAGQTGRRTNWNIVCTLYPLDRNIFLQRCMEIVQG